MAKQIPDIRKNNPTPLPLLIAAHCSTIQRKAKRLEINELTAILDDLVRELYPKISSVNTYINSINKIIRVFNANFPPILSEINSHYFFIIIRNTIRNILQQLVQLKKLNDQDTYTLRNCTLFINHLVKQIKDVSRILHWITDETFLDALANCLNRIDKISKKDQNRRVIKQITRLLDVFCNIQERLPLDLHRTFFVRLFQPTLQCLTSSNYVKLFQNFPANTDKFTEKQKLYLIKCPYFLTTYNGPHIEQAVEQVLEIMLPRYVSILDEHMKTIKQWNRPIMRAIHNLIITIIYAEGYFSSYTKSDSFRELINHLLNILNESKLINKIQSNSNNIETLLTDTTLVVFNVLVHESDALDYIKQRKPIEIFRQLTKTSNEIIVLNAYTMLAYTMDDNDIKTSKDDLIQLLSTTISLLQKTTENPQQNDINRNILQLLETLKGLVQYEKIQNEILKQDTLTFLIDYYKKLDGLAKQTLLECIWKLSFNTQIAQQLRGYPQFIHSLENIPKSVNENIPQYAIHRSNSYNSVRKSQSAALIEAVNYEIQKITDGLLWKIVKEPQFKEKIIQKIRTTVANDHQKYKYNIMISYCYADKDIVHKIHQFLAYQGYEIWFDRDHNNKFAMEIVAEAIENSELVIICMSDSYKRDSHCQAQAEYALISERILLPLVVHDSYKPDGWLSSIISNNNYIDIATYDFKVASELLLKEIKQRQPRKDIIDVKPTVSTPVGIVRNRSDNMTNFDKPYTPVQSSALTGETNSSMSSFPLVTINRQQPTPVNSISRPSTPGAIFSVSPVIVVKQQQQAPIKSISTSSISDSFPSDASMTVNKQQQQQQQQQQPTPVNSISRPSTPGAIFSVSPVIVVKQQQQAPIESISTSSIPNSFPSGASVTANKQQQQQQQLTPPMHPILKPSTPEVSSLNVSITHIQQREVLEHSASRSSTSSSDSSDLTVINLKQEKQKLEQSDLGLLMPSTDTSVTSTFTNKQQHQTSIQFVSQSATPVNGAPPTPVVIDQQPLQESAHSATKSSTSNIIPFDASINIEKKEQQQQSMNSVTQSSSTGTVPSVKSSDIVQKQQQPTASRSNSRSGTPSILPVALQTNGRGQVRLPDKYTNRKTHNSIYRHISINAWRDNDVLDYLFDLYLYPMMPLCESMSGKALLRLFRMCQKKPSRVYDQLNEELRNRFNGLTLSMGTYTQFLIEMDSLVGPTLDTLPPLPPIVARVPNILERVIYMPPTNPQYISTQPSFGSSIHSSTSSKKSETIKSVETRPETTTPGSTRFVERAIFRPASNVGRPYNFIVESIEEPTMLHDQVQRYGNQLLVLDETARNHREINSLR